MGNLLWPVLSLIVLHQRKQQSEDCQILDELKKLVCLGLQFLGVHTFVPSHVRNSL